MSGSKRIGYYAIKLVRPARDREGDEPRQQIASVKAHRLSEAIAIALRRYPGYIAVHGERH